LLDPPCVESFVFFVFCPPLTKRDDRCSTFSQPPIFLHRTRLLPLNDHPPPRNSSCSPRHPFPVPHLPWFSQSIRPIIAGSSQGGCLIFPPPPPPLSTSRYNLFPKIRFLLCSYPDPLNPWSAVQSGPLSSASNYLTPFPLTLRF